VTLLYPFYPREDFPAAAAALRQALADVRPFKVSLEEFGLFEHGSRSCTLWLAPEPADALVRLHEALWRAAPDCADVRRHLNGFTPHLSVGQAQGVAQARELLGSLRADWRPITFVAREVSLIWRGEPPDDVFRADRSIALGGM
jgi:2'-5' RNA ligase